MLTKAFVLIETEMGRAKEINGLLRRFEEIMSTDLVTNPYDIIAIVGGRTEKELEDFVSRKLRPIDGIVRTVLCEAVPLAGHRNPVAV
jgi:DNA-binding Lrp family transcriptional regulator